MKKCVDLYKQAYQKMREASLQSHYGHWDGKGTGGQNCPECVKSRELRSEADALFDEAEKCSKLI